MSLFLMKNGRKKEGLKEGRNEAAQEDDQKRKKKMRQERKEGRYGHVQLKSCRTREVRETGRERDIGELLQSYCISLSM